MIFDAKRAFEVCDWFAYKANVSWREDIRQEMLLYMWEHWPKARNPRLLALKALERLGLYRNFYPLPDHLGEPARWPETVELLHDLDSLGLTDAERSAIIKKLRGEPLGKEKNRLTCVRDRLRRRG
jgi:hypothetical protein